MTVFVEKTKQKIYLNNMIDACNWVEKYPQVSKWKLPTCFKILHLPQQTNPGSNYQVQTNQAEVPV